MAQWEIQGHLRDCGVFRPCWTDVISAGRRVFVAANPSPPMPWCETQFHSVAGLRRRREAPPRDGPAMWGIRMTLV